MPTIRITGGVKDTLNGLKFVAANQNKRCDKATANAAKRGNRNARAFASEQHTMFSEVDAEYPFAMTVERVGPHTWEYGPDASLPEGSKATGYEYGSINQAYPHLDVTRSFDIEQVEFPMDISDEVRLLWKEAGW